MEGRYDQHTLYMYEILKYLKRNIKRTLLAKERVEVIATAVGFITVLECTCLLLKMKYTWI